MERITRILTDVEADTLLNEMLITDGTRRQVRNGHRNHAMTMLMLETGLRVGELVQLTINDLYIEGEPVNWLKVRSAIAKNKTGRIIPMSVPARLAIVEMEKHVWHWHHWTPSDFAFYGQTHYVALSTRQVERMIKMYSRDAIEKTVTPHTLRHTFATRVLRTSNTRIVQKLLGHKRIATTQIYTHPNDQDLREAIDKSDVKRST